MCPGVCVCVYMCVCVHVCVHVCVFMCVFTCALMCMRYNVIVRILFLSVHVCARAWVPPKAVAAQQCFLIRSTLLFAYIVPFIYLAQ